MKSVIIVFGILFYMSCSKKQEHPNIVFILADDLGYGEIGVYGQQLIETPNIDSLAKSGILFTQHYSGSPVCAPSRSVLLTGKHSGHTYIRGNDELKDRGNVWNYLEVFKNEKLEGQRPLSDSVLTFAELIQSSGYETGFIGKWGLGGPGTEGDPNNQGFSYFFGYNCQRQAHTLYPMHLWENDKKIILNNKAILPHSGLDLGSDIYDVESYSKFSLKEYAPDVMHKKAIGFIEQNTNKRFLLIYASPLPHVPLQAPNKWTNYYKNKLGNESPYIGKNYFPNQTPRATYAAMISTLDEQVGNLIAVLKKNNLLENTIIVFTSDNGPTYTGGADTKFFNSAKPFSAAYGWGKGFLKEGGIRVPMIVNWSGRIKPGSKTDHLSAFQDFLPTFVELCGAGENPKTDGISFLNVLLGKKQTKNHEYLYCEIPEYGGQQAVRIDNYKGIRKGIFKGNLEIELFDLSKDLKEKNNIAKDHPQILSKVRHIMTKEHTPSQISSFRFAAFGE